MGHRPGNENRRTKCTSPATASMHYTRLCLSACPPEAKASNQQSLGLQQWLTQYPCLATPILDCPCLAQVEFWCPTETHIVMLPPQSLQVVDKDPFNSDPEDPELMSEEVGDGLGDNNQHRDK
jgi:hypothetical protein